MTDDLRYYDLTPRLQEHGIDWMDLDSYLQLDTIHPFVDILGEKIELCADPLTKDLIEKYGRGIVVFDQNYHVSREDSSFHFLVHVGAVELVCEYLGLPKISRHEATQENIDKDLAKPPKLDRGPKEFLEVREAAKKLWDRANSQKNKREANRMRLVASVLDHDQELRKLFGSD